MHGYNFKSPRPDWATPNCPRHPPHRRVARRTATPRAHTVRAAWGEAGHVGMRPASTRPRCEACRSQVGRGGLASYRRSGWPGGRWQSCKIAGSIFIGKFGRRGFRPRVGGRAVSVVGFSCARAAHMRGCLLASACQTTLRKYEEFCGSMQAHKPARNRRHLYPPRKSRHRASGGDRLRGLRNGSRQLVANNHSHGGNACASPALSSTSHRLQLCQAAPGGLKLRKLIWPTGRADRRGNHTHASRPRAPTPSSASPGPP
jgi:hypothetical protein